MRWMTSTLAVVALAAFAGTSLAGDIIIQSSGRPLGNPKASDPPTADDFAGSNFTVIEENLDKVIYKIAGLGQAQSVPTDKVVAVHHDPANMPAGLARGEDLVNKGQYLDAMDRLQGVLDNRAAPVWAKAQAEYLIALATSLVGTPEEGVAALKAFAANNQNSWHVPKATQALARTLMAAGDVKAAQATFQSMKTMKGLSESDQIGADYGIAWIEEQVALGKGDSAGLAKAEKMYNAILLKVRGRTGFSELAGKCTVGKASCQLGQGQTASAKTLCTALVTKNTDPLLRAGGHTLLGRAIYKESAGANDREALKVARLHFLKVVTLYGSTPGAEDYLAESLYYAGELFKELAPLKRTTDEEKSKAREANMRAVREWRECIQRFPRSSWAKKAQLKLSGG